MAMFAVRIQDDHLAFGPTGQDEGSSCPCRRDLASSSALGRAAGLVLLVLLAVSPARGGELTLEQLQSLPGDCPLVYDNDWLQDTPDIYYLLVKAHQGQADLRGLVLTKDQWDDDRQYRVEQGLEDFRKTIAVARRAGLQRIPEITIGAERKLARPASGRIEDADAPRSAGAELIVRQARLASPQKPLIVFVGGPPTTVAGAYLIDSSIADRVIVFMTDLQGYNGGDAWANTILATRLKMANYGANPVWWPQRPAEPVMPLERFRRLPRNPLVADVERIATAFWQRSTRREKPDRDDGFADGAGIFLLFKPQSWKSVRKMKVTGAFSARVADGGDYDYLDAVDLDYALMREEFFSTLSNAELAGSQEGK